LREHERLDRTERKALQLAVGKMEDGAGIHEGRGPMIGDYFGGWRNGGRVLGTGQGHAGAWAG
jgi:hypothetical protein